MMNNNRISIRSIQTLLLVLAATAFMVSSAQAVSPSSWLVRGQGAFAEGDLEGVYVDPENVMRLGPQVTPLWQGQIPFVWKAVQADDGSLYLGTGHEAAVYRIRRGNVERFWKGPGAEIFAMALLPDGSLLAGVSPGAQLYRLRGKEQAELVADLPEEYIWDLLVAGNTVFIATGSSEVSRGGAVYQWNAERNAAPTELYRGTDPHVLSLCAGPENSIYAGTQGRGLLLKISADGTHRVLFDAPEKEINDITVDPSGAVIVSTVAENGGNENGAQDAMAELMGLLASAAAQANANNAENHPSEYSYNDHEPDLYASGGGRVYRVDPSFDIDLIFSAPQGERINAIEYVSGKLWIAASRGRVYRLEADEKASFYLEVDESEVLEILPSGIITTGSSGSVYRVTPERSEKGVYLSKVFDSLSLPRWGAVSWVGEGDLEFAVRTGNTEKPDASWFDWRPVEQNYGNIDQPPSRFAQFRVAFKPSRTPPILREVNLSFQIPNQRPRLQGVIAAPLPTLLRRNPMILGQAGELGPILLQVFQMLQPQMGDGEFSEDQALAPFRSMILVSFAAQDYDQDPIVYEISIRPEGQQQWQVVKEDLTRAPYFLNGELYPDGRYEVRVVASDRRGNTPEIARTDEAVSPPFTIDSTPPTVTLRSRREGENIRITGTARDALLPLSSLEYSVDGGRWRPLIPADGIVDQPEEQFSFVINADETAESVVVKAVDAVGNHGAARIQL